jgi:acetylornithine deacetylase/succinyl-diaminopimelate desuccinylase-like protein
MHDDLASAVHELFPAVKSDLDALVRIPSVSAAGFDPDQVQRSAEATAALLRGAGMEDVQMLEMAGVHPAVFGAIPAPPGAPTVLLYAHHDVQPPGEDDGWEGEPFVPFERDGRMYGRGSSDDKAGIVTHVGALRAFDGKPPVGVKIFVEGEEETGSAHLPAFIARFHELLAADVIVIADSGNWRAGTPALTTSLRGLISVIVEVEVLKAGVHSGEFGGAVPDALTVLCRVLAGLHDDAGNVAVPGLVAFESDPLDLTEEELRSQAGVLPGVELIGEGALTSRMWSRPAAAVLAIDATPLAKAINQLIPRARAKVSVRLAPGDDPDRAMKALVEFIESRPAWGATVRATPHESGHPFALTGEADPRMDVFRRAFAEAYGRDTVDMGVGGSIPFVAAFSEAFPDATIVLTGAGDPTSQAHGPNESVDLADLEHAILAEAIAMRLLAR